MTTDYYLALGVTPDASEHQVKRAYRMLSSRHHPDRAGEVEAPFLQIKEAYEALSDPIRRAEYYEQLDRSKLSAEPLQPDPVDLFNSFATYRPSREAVFDAFVRGFTGRGIPKSGRLGEMNLEIALSPAQAARGGCLPIDIPVGRLCARCDGTGRTGFFHCDACDGHGLAWGQARVELHVSRGTSDGAEIPVPLSHLGVEALSLNVHLRLSGA